MKYKNFIFWQPFQCERTGKSCTSKEAENIKSVIHDIYFIFRLFLFASSLSVRLSEPLVSSSHKGMKKKRRKLLCMFVILFRTHVNLFQNLCTNWERIHTVKGLKSVKFSSDCENLRAKVRKRNSLWKDRKWSSDYLRFFVIALKKIKKRMMSRRSSLLEKALIFKDCLQKVSKSHSICRMFRRTKCRLICAPIIMPALFSFNWQIHEHELFFTFLCTDYSSVLLTIQTDPELTHQYQIHTMVVLFVQCGQRFFVRSRHGVDTFRPC